MSLCYWRHHPLLYFSLTRNGPPPMSTLVSARRRLHSSSCTGSLRGSCPASLYQQLAQCNTDILLRISPSCHHVAQWRQRAWCKETHGFIPRKIQWHIHAGLWSLVNWEAWSTYETLYKVVMNINEVAVSLEEWPRPWWWSVYAWYPDTFIKKRWPINVNQI